MWIPGVIQTGGLEETVFYEFRPLENPSWYRAVYSTRVLKNPVLAGQRVVAPGDFDNSWTIPFFGKVLPTTQLT